MKILTFIAIVTICTALALIAGIFGAAHLILDQNLEMSETETMSEDFTLVRHGLRAQLDDLTLLCTDYATWDDTYAFVQSPHEAYLRSNLVPETFCLSHLDTILIFDAEGALLYGAAYDRPNRSLVPADPALLTYLRAHGISPAVASSGEVTTGLVPLPQGPMMVSAAPVLRSSGEGPAQGTLVFGRDLAGGEAARIRDITGLDITFFLPGDPAALAGIAGTDLPNGENTPVIVRSPDGATISGVARITDIAGEPALFARLDTPRDGYFRNRDIISALVAVIVAVCAGFGLLLIGTIYFTVIRRFEDISRTVTAIRKDQDFSHRLPPGKTDEMMMLSTSVNDLLSFLEEYIAEKERAKQILEESREKYCQLFQTATDAITIIRRGQFSDCNQRALEMLGWQKEEMVLHSPLDISPEFQPDGRRSAEAWQEYYDRACRHDSPRFEWRTLRQDGTYVDTEVTLTRFDLASAPYLLAIARDITGRKEEERLKAEAFARIEENLEQFAILNDEIRNPLQVIQAVIEMHAGDEKEIVLEQVRRIDRLVDDLDAGYIESEKVRDFLKKHYHFGKKE
ncbi:CHASE4 domain-containing protein [Methanofollis ethanolicus]|uniref:CHASE4 domain-containing protein n=1 Tax=Methanofollis ethanolicus TaxID=488124 RepID=UPI0008355731|nr:CHASE4 domain-containing protein [Methanofollis ethanolicus]